MLCESVGAGEGSVAFYYLGVSAATGDGVVVVVGGGGVKANQEEYNKMASPSYDFSYELSTHTHSRVPFLFYYSHPIHMHTLLV